MAREQDIIQLFPLRDFNEDLIPLLSRNFDAIVRSLGNSQLFDKNTVKPFLANVNLMDVRNLIENSRADFGLAGWAKTGTVAIGGTVDQRNGQSGDYYFILTPGLAGIALMEQVIDAKNMDHRNYYYLSAYYSTDSLTKGGSAYFRVRVTLTYHDGSTEDFDMDIAI